MDQVLIANPPPVAGSGAVPGIAGNAGEEAAALPFTTIRVFIADDHPFVRSVIKRCINDSPGMRVIGEAGTALEVFDFMGRSKCDVLVLDIGLPDQSGLDVLRILKKSHPRLPVLILTMYPEDQFSQFCMRTGAAGFLSKSNASAHLVDAIRKAARNGRGALPPAGGLPAPALAIIPSVLPHEALSGREFQIFCQIASGRTQKAIALELKLSAKTVSASRARILKVMGMSKDDEIIRYVAANHLCS